MTPRARIAWAVLPALLLIPAAHGLFDARLAPRVPSLHLLDRNWRFIAALDNGLGGFGYWDMPDTLPEALVATALAAEDRRFASHPGVDPRAIAGAFRDHYLRGGPPRGASTLAMQVARLQRNGGSGWYWKFHDAAAALGLTARLGREGVLRAYFRDAPYGNRIAGAACAARRYFRKPAADLSLAEAALLAAIPKAPSRFNLFEPEGFAAARRRAALILRRAAAGGLIGGAQKEGALAELSSFRPPVRQARDPGILHYLRRASRQAAASGRRGGEMRTTLDLVVHDSLQALIKRELPRLLKWQAGNAAALAVDVRSGDVLAYVGSQDYFDPRGGAIDFASVPRSTGSLLKPFIYAMGMEWRGFTPATVLTDLGHDFGSGNRSFVPENYDHKYMGPVLYKDALANSRNIPAVQVLKAVGVEEFYRRCIALGLAADDGKAGHYGLGLSIGGLYCTLQQVAEAYLSLANRGEGRRLAWEMPDPVPGPRKAERIGRSGYDAGRESLSDVSGNGESVRRVMPADVALQIRRFLADPAARLPAFPRGGNLEYPFAVAAKTGTSEGYRDSWCVAFSDTYLVAVWIGNADFSPTKGLSGYEGAARIAKAALRSLHPDRLDGLDDAEFPPPPGYAPLSICRLTGKRADRSTPFSTLEYFRPGTEPLDFSDAQQTLPVDARNGLLAHPGCGVPLRWKRFTVLDPRFREWAAAQGLEVPPERVSPACGGEAAALSYALSIVSPRGGSRFFLDPEMPEGGSLLPIACRVSPAPASILWLADGEEVAEVAYPFTLKWPMRPGRHSFQAVVPGTGFRSSPVSLEVF